MVEFKYRNKGGSEDCPDGMATKYKGCGQERQMDEGWKKDVRVRKGTWEAGRRDRGKHGSSSNTLVHQNHREGAGSGGGGKNTDALTCMQP